MIRRPGMTLVEVLVAIFIMAIGLLALLTLFPLGALNMAQAIKDERTAEAAISAGGIADITWSNPTGTETWTIRERDPSIANRVPPNPALPSGMLNPGTSPGCPPTLTPNRIGPAWRSRPSYPVLVDPIGYLTYGANWQQPGNTNNWVAAQPPLYPGIPRRTLRILLRQPPGDIGVDPNMTFPASQKQAVLRWSTLLDDLTFDQDGIPLGAPKNLTDPPGILQREGRYSWAWLVRRPYAGTGTATDLSVIVYSGRSLDLGSNLGPQGENSYVANFGYDFNNTPTARVVNIQWSGPTKPNITPGSWILDGTMQPDPRGFFYRVVNVTDTGASASGMNSLDVEVQTELKATGPGYVIVLDKVVEVFERLFHN